MHGGVMVERVCMTLSFFFNDTATTEIYTLSLHDALPIFSHSVEVANLCAMMAQELGANVKVARRAALLHDVGKAIDHEVEGTHALIGGRFAKKRSEEHTSELQSRQYLVCRLLLEKKKKNDKK